MEQRSRAALGGPSGRRSTLPPASNGNAGRLLSLRCGATSPLGPAVRCSSCIPLRAPLLPPPPLPACLPAAMLNPNPEKRIGLDEIFQHPWFVKVRVRAVVAGGGGGWLVL